MKKEKPEDIEIKITRLFKEARQRIADGWVPRRDFMPEGQRRDAAEWIRKQRERVGRAIRDRDLILFERAITSWEKAFEKINFICGEAYRKRYPDPEEWPLRYFRWMKIRFMKLESELGTFYLVPRMPERAPSVDHWITADEMLAILSSPTTIKAIKTFGLPSRPDCIGKPLRGEKHLISNHLNDGNPTAYYNFPEGVHRG